MEQQILFALSETRKQNESIYIGSLFCVLRSPTSCLYPPQIKYSPTNPQS